MANWINKTQSSFSGGIISTELLGRIDFEKLQTGLRQCENFIVRPVGGVQYSAGTKLVVESLPNARLIPFIENKDNTYCLEFSNNKIRVINETGVLFEIATTFLDSELKRIKYAQYENKLYLTHENHKPCVIEHSSDGSWSIRDLQFNTPINKDVYMESVSGTAGSHSSQPVVNYDRWQYAMSVMDKDGNESLPIFSSYITSDIALSQQPITVKGVLKDAAVQNNSPLDWIYFYRVRGGDFFFVQKMPYVNGQKEYVFTDGGLALDETKAIKEEFDNFGGENPRAVSFFNQRLIFGGTKSKPNDIWGSRVGEFEDFTTTINLSPSESFNLTLASGTLDEIESMMPLDSLIIFSSGKIWRVSGTSVSNMQADIESYSSISELSPAATKKSILYVDASLNTISNFVYSYELNGFVGQNLDILARELFDGYEFIAQSFRNNPFPVFFAVRNDGIMLALTYLREENIYAWSKLSTNGKYKDVCCLGKQVNDDIYVIVERQNGTYIEIFADQISANGDVEDSCHLHSSVIFENPSSTSFSVPHLKGMTVTIVADKNVFRDNIVGDDGIVEFDYPEGCKRVVIGLPYRGIIQTIPFETLNSAGSSTIGVNRKICSVSLMYYKTRGIKYGTSINGLTEIKPYQQTNFAEDIPLETGKFNFPVSSSWELDTSFFIVQDYPLPCFLQNITMEILYGQKN